MTSTNGKLSTVLLNQTENFIYLIPTASDALCAVALNGCLGLVGHLEAVFFQTQPGQAQASENSP